MRTGKSKNKTLPTLSTDWPSPELLVEKYNSETPDECPEVTKLTPARKKKSLDYLKAFPEESFWVQVFSNIKNSEFLRGKRNGQGHHSFIASFDWLLTKGKDGTENCVKVYEGQYGD